MDGKKWLDALKIGVRKSGNGLFKGGQKSSQSLANGVENIIKETKRANKKRKSIENIPIEKLTDFQRWRLLTFHKYVKLKTLDWDPDLPGVYHLDITLIKKSKLPVEAVHVTGEPNTYAIDKIKVRYGRHDDGFGALDAYLYMENNAINKALALKWNEWNHVDAKRILIIGGVAILVILVGWFVLRGH